MIKNLFFLLFFLLITALPVHSNAETGILEIYSEPSGAKVYIDTSFVGKTPYEDFYAPVGPVKIKVVSRNKYKPQYWETTIDSLTPQTKTFYFDQ